MNPHEGTPSRLLLAGWGFRFRVTENPRPGHEKTPIQLCNVRTTSTSLCANRDCGGLPGLRVNVVDHHIPTVINDIAMPVGWIGGEYFDFVWGFDVESSPQHFLARGTARMHALRCATWHDNPVHHGLVALDTAAGEHDCHAKSANSNQQTCPSDGLPIDRFHFQPP